MYKWKPLFSPAVRFMDRLRIPYKIAVVALIFSIPLLSFLSLLSVDIRYERNFLLLETRGFNCTLTLSKLMAGMQEHRGLAAMYLSGDPSVRVRLLATQAGLDSQMKEFLRLHESGEEVILEYSKAENLSGRWEELKGAFWKMGAEESFSAHTELITRVISDIERVAHLSNMSQDRDQRTSALVEGMAFRLPLIMEYSGRLRALGSGLLVSSTLDTADMGQLKAIASVARAELKGLSNAFEPLLLKDTEMDERLGPEFHTSVDSFLSSLRMLDEGILNTPRTAMEPMEYFAHFTRSIRGGLSLHTSIMGILEIRLKERLAFLNLFRQALYIGTPACILILLYFSLASYLSLRQSFMSLSDATIRIRSGERSVRVPVSTSDEMADVSGTFNEMARSIEANEAKLSSELDKHKQTSAHLLEAREILQTYARELELKSQGLAEALGLADEASRSRDEFFAKISHEMRTPLTCVIGVADLLNDTSLTSEQRGRVQMLMDSSEMLLQYINEILDYSKIEAGELRLEECVFELRQRVKTAVMPLSVIARNKGLGFKVDIDESLPETVLGDPVRLAQVLINLLNNALKYTASGEVSLEVSGSSTSGEGAGDEGWVIFSVRDTGAGIPDEDLEDIFTPYHQVSGNPVNRSTGTGLGLAISKACVELMGGKLRAMSQPGKGSTFSFSVRLKPAEGLEPCPQLVEPTFYAPQDAAATEPFGRHCVLLVDDNPINHKIYSKFLTNSGLIVHSAMGGIEALAKARETEFDLVLLDVLMPDMDGPEVSSIIREQESRPGASGRRVPIIALSASVTPQTRERCLECGMDAFLEKPISPDKFISTVRNHLRIDPVPGA